MTDTRTVPRDLRVVRVGGPSDAGKTTLVERLVGELGDDRAVATIKSIHHDIEPDESGTDTHRHRTAGADAAVGITPSFAFEVTPHGHGTHSDPDAAKRTALFDALARFGDRGFEVAIVEGFTGVALPTVHLGDRDADEVAGEVIATGEDELDRIVSAVLGIDPAEHGSRTGSERRGAAVAATQQGEPRP